MTEDFDGISSAEKVSSPTLGKYEKHLVFKGFLRFQIVSDFVKRRFVKKLVKTRSASWEAGYAAVCQTHSPSSNGKAGESDLRVSG